MENRDPVTTHERDPARRSAAQPTRLLFLVVVMFALGALARFVTGRKPSAAGPIMPAPAETPVQPAPATTHAADETGSSLDRDQPHAEDAQAVPTTGSDPARAGTPRPSISHLGKAHASAIWDYAWRRDPVADRAAFVAHREEFERQKAAADPVMRRVLAGAEAEDTRQFEGTRRMLMLERAEGATAPFANHSFHVVSSPYPISSTQVAAAPGREVLIPSSPQASAESFALERGVDVTAGQLASLSDLLAEFEQRCIARRRAIIAGIHEGIRAGAATRTEAALWVSGGQPRVLRIADDPELQRLIAEAQAAHTEFATSVARLFR